MKAAAHRSPIRGRDRHAIMLLQRAGLPAVKVVDVVDIARAAGRVIMEVYKTDREV